jgi:hypothetical protein
MTKIPASADDSWLTPWTDYVEAAEHAAGLAVPDERPDLMNALHDLFKADASPAAAAALIRKAHCP